MKRMENTTTSGRPSKYNPENDEQAYKLALLGAKDEQIADFFGIDIATLYRWKNKYPTFRDTLKRGKLMADSEVAHSLYRRALGYSHADVIIMMDQKTGKPVSVDTIKHYPPDTTAAIFWLKNRAKEVWREKQTVEFDTLNDEQVNAIVNTILKK